MGQRLTEDHYRDKIKSFPPEKRLSLEEVQMSRQFWEFLVSEAKVAGEGLSQGDLKKNILSKIAAEAKDKVPHSQAEKKVNGH